MKVVVCDISKDVCNLIIENFFNYYVDKRVSVLNRDFRSLGLFVIY